MTKSRRIFVAGHQGLVGSALVRALSKQADVELVVKTHSELDLNRQADVEAFFRSEAIDEVYMAAAKVGGIYANNTYPAEFIYQNLIVECNVIQAAHAAHVDKLLFLGSSCIYPKLAEQPMNESALLTGFLEPTNEPYAVAKIAGIKLCESYNRQYDRDYRSVMPTNLYGINDNFHPENSHVLPALLRRFHDAKVRGDESVTIWGSGQPKREFLYVDDMAAACVHVMSLEKAVYQSFVKPMQSHVNIGTGQDCSIRELAESIKEVTGFSGRLLFDASKPDGMPRKLLDVSLLKSMGWEATTDLREGLKHTYDWYVQNESSLRM